VVEFVQKFVLLGETQFDGLLRIKQGGQLVHYGLENQLLQALVDLLDFFVELECLAADDLLEHHVEERKLFVLHGLLYGLQHGLGDGTLVVDDLFSGGQLGIHASQVHIRKQLLLLLLVHLKQLYALVIRTRIGLLPDVKVLEDLLLRYALLRGLGLDGHVGVEHIHFYHFQLECLHDAVLVAVVLGDVRVHLQLLEQFDGVVFGLLIHVVAGRLVWVAIQETVHVVDVVDVASPADLVYLVQIVEELCFVLRGLN